MVETHNNDLEQHFFFHMHQVLIPLIDAGDLLSRVGAVIVGSCEVGTMVGAPVNLSLRTASLIYSPDEP